MEYNHWAADTEANVEETGKRLYLGIPSLAPCLSFRIWRKQMFLAIPALSWTKTINSIMSYSAKKQLSGLKAAQPGKSKH